MRALLLRRRVAPLLLLLAGAAFAAAAVGLLSAHDLSLRWTLLPLLCATVTGVLLALAARSLFARPLVAPLSSLPPPSLTESPAPSSTAQLAAPALSPPASALLEATMNSMREGVLVIDEALRVVASNRAARDIFGHSGSRLEALRLSELTRNSSIHEAFLAAVEQGERAEVKVETRGLDRRILELRVVPLRPEREMGTRRGALGVFFDITQLERLERVRQEFLSNVSHELRTPLTAILAFVETLEDGAIDDTANNRRFLSVIRKNASRMHNLIDDILELSAIEAGTVMVEPTPTRLQPIVNDVITALAARAGARQVSVQNEVGPDAFVYADPRRLEQMLTNLIDNAIKFNREGGRVSIRHELVVGERARLSVSDTGEGISPEHIERIFERFYRVDRARSRALGGTGLGLAIVKHLARVQGGEAAVISSPGEGSTFTIELPASSPAPLPPSPATSTPSAPVPSR